MLLQENAAFISFANESAGVIFDDSNHDKYPITYYNVINGEGFTPKKDCSYYGYVYKGLLCIKRDNSVDNYLSDGMYFSSDGTFQIDKAFCHNAVIIEVHHTKGIYPENKYRAMFTIGGPIEEHGRLKYIDGCTDSLLIAPVKFGDPCFNHLHFPTDITQTPHTHPSHRIGIVAKGNGECITPFGNLPLTKGMIFVIKEWDGKTFAVGIDGKEYEIGNHCFYTKDESMDVIAFHPDSDFGPKDEFHPMINRTIVNGISANQIDSIRTK
jgi:hypothetical protein